MIYRSERCYSDVKFSFNLNGKPIKSIKSVKYLGHFICDDLKDDMDVKRQMQQTYAHGNMLFMFIYIFYFFFMCSAGVRLKLFYT